MSAKRTTALCILLNAMHEIKRAVTATLAAALLSGQSNKENAKPFEVVETTLDQVKPPISRAS
jgi:hypothetical protein